jgi:PKD repeat protein
MKKWVLVALAVVLIPLTAFGQWVDNQDLDDDGWVAPGELVVAQNVIVYGLETTQNTATAATGATWTVPTNAQGSANALCASTANSGAQLALTGFVLGVPAGATIAGIKVTIVGAAGSASDTLLVRLYSGTRFAPVSVTTGLPLGACGVADEVELGDYTDRWGKSWTPAEVNALGVQLTPTLTTASTVYVDAVIVEVYYYEGATTVTALRVMNTDVGDSTLEGSDIDRIEVVRVSDDRVIGSQVTATQLAKLTTTGVPVTINSSYKTFTGSLELEIRVRLKATVALGTYFTLGETHVTVGTEIDVEYAKSSATAFTVGPSPAVAFDGSVPDDETYRGERFLAGRIEVDAGDVPFDFTTSQVVLTNVASAGTKLSGSSIARIEIRRASDGALLGEQTVDSDLSKLTTTGCKVTTSSNNQTSAYGTTQLEIWVTLETSVPAGRTLQFEAVVRCAEADFVAGDGVDPIEDFAPVFTSGQATGFEEVTNLELDGGQVFSGQRFLAQRIQVVDSDVAPFDVTVTSLVIQNMADSAVRLAENQIVRIEVVRARDGAAMGSVSSTSGLNGGGVRVTTSSSNIVTDDSSEILEIWVTLGASVPDARLLQLKSVIWHNEDSTTFGRVLVDAGPEFITGPAVGEGLEEATSSTLTSRAIFQGARFLAQRLKLGDDDDDPYDVAVTSIMVRNVVGDSPLADQNFARLEVRRTSDGSLLGEVTNPVGLSLAGVRVTTSASNVVPDDTTVELEIWVTLKSTAPVGRKVELESVVWHTEGVATFQTLALIGPATFTTETGTPPTGVEFTWLPSALKYNEEVTFTPATGITDPEGDVKKATFRWSFGDGGTAETTGSAAAKHTFAIGGTFSVVLTVTGEGGLSTSKTHEVVVEGPPNVVPTVTFTWAPQAPAEGATVTFTSTVTDSDQPTGTPHTYAWDFGDTGTSALSGPTHAFAEKKTYTVKLTVTDARSASVTVEHTISIGNAAPVVGTLIASNVSPNTGDPVTFTVGSVTDADVGDTIASYKWAFGDGSTLTTTTTPPPGTATHVFNAPGTHIVSVIAVDSRGGESLPKTVTVTVSGPTRVILYAYPNPASTQATFSVLLPDGATDPILRVYTLDGRPVIEVQILPGQTTYLWNLLDAAGDRVGNGLYFGMVTASAAGGGSVRSEVFRLLVVR